jgi:hypothetical protein
MLPLVTFADARYPESPLRALRHSCQRNGAELTRLSTFDVSEGTPYEEFPKSFFVSGMIKFNLVCFCRHIAIYEHAKSRGLQRYIMMDPDVLLNERASDALAEFLPNDVDVMLSHIKRDIPGTENLLAYSPHFSFWTREAHKDFIEFFIEQYATEAGRDRIRAIGKANRSVVGSSIVSEMTLLHLWANVRKPAVFNSTAIRNGVTIDHNISLSNHAEPNQFRIRYGMKQLVRRDGRLYFVKRDGSLVYPIALHFQGRDKMLMSSIMAGNLGIGRAMSLVIDCAKRIRSAKRRVFKPV